MLYAFNGLHKEGVGDARFEQRDKDRPIISNLFDTFVAVRAPPVNQSLVLSMENLSEKLQRIGKFFFHPWAKFIINPFGIHFFILNPICKETHRYS